MHSPLPERTARVRQEPVISPVTSPLQTSQDVARFFGRSLPSLLYTLYRAPVDQRYRQFQIPKRTGGTRTISAPKGDLREMQATLKTILETIYDAHPAAHGFIPKRSVVTNASQHADQHLVLNIDLADFFPSINFGRVRGLFMAPPFAMGPGAATLFAQICVHENGLPQGAPTSPMLSNFIAMSLDRRLLRLAREHRLKYSRYADDITFSTRAAVMPPVVAVVDHDDKGQRRVKAGVALEGIVSACGFEINPKKVRLQGRGQRQSVTGLIVNKSVNVERERIRNLRAMLHAWKKFGLDAAASAHFEKRGASPRIGPGQPADNSGARAFRNIVYGHLSFIKMVRGKEDALFLKLCSALIGLDPNPSKFVREMIFGAADFDVFISHASEDKAEVARPIYAACQTLGLKAFLDEEHIAWGQSFASKINTALGSSRTVLCVVSPNSVTKEWPTAEVNAALALEISGEKNVVVVLVGQPDLSHLPLIKTKKYLKWANNPYDVARDLKRTIKGETNPVTPPPPPLPRQTAVPVSAPAGLRPQALAPLTAFEVPNQPTPKRGLLSRLFRKKS